MVVVLPLLASQRQVVGGAVFHADTMVAMVVLAVAATLTGPLETSLMADLEYQAKVITAEMALLTTPLALVAVVVLAQQVGQVVHPPQAQAVTALQVVSVELLLIMLVAVAVHRKVELPVLLV
mgnify:CR=1 FL=1